MVPSRTFKVTYTEEMLRDAVRTFVWKRIFTSQKAVWAIEVALLPWLFWYGDRGWLTGAVGIVILLLPLMVASIWIAHHRNTIGTYRRMPTPQAEFTFYDKEFEVMSALGSAKIPWSTITEIWERPSYWMIFTAPNQFMTLPVQTLSATDRDFLRSKAPSA